VHASNATRLEKSFRDIAERIELPGQENPKADVFKLVYDWLLDERHGKWLLVLDNADDASVLAPSSDGIDTPSHHISTYLPLTRNSSVLVTSRTRQAASRLVEESDIIQIEPMHAQNAQALLEVKLGDKVATDGVAELAAAL